MTIPVHSKLCVSVFGEGDLTLNGKSLIASSRSAKWLLTYLVLRHDQTIPYEEMEHDLWGKPAQRGCG